MDTLSLTEALVSLLVEQSDVDASNAVAKLRAAQQRVAAELRPHLDQTLDVQMSVDEVDDILIHASRNGHVDLFAVSA